MGFFQEVEGEAAVLVENGVYKQTPLYLRDGYLYAKVSGGFVRLMADGSTTKSRMRLDHISFEAALCRDPLGKLCTSQVAGSAPLPSDRRRLLLGGA